MAVFFVDDEELKKSEDGIVPICLPDNNGKSATNAIHSGWSSPPPLKFLNQSLPLHVPYYEAFFKQWHYAMKIKPCQDPNTFKFPSNSSYPPGVMCAVEKFGEFCPSSGESGSPLMVQEDSKFSAYGISSFIKGCSVFYIASRPAVGESFLVQKSINPTVYTKLSCYLPWIAEQYQMEYEANENIDSDCVNFTGDINEVTADVCRVIATEYEAGAGSYLDNVEAQCIFNFTVNNQDYDGCLMSGIDDFTHPVFKCPIRAVKGRNSFQYFTNYTTTSGQQINEVLNGVYCPTNSVGAIFKLDPFADGINVVSYIFNSEGPVFGPNSEYELDPENEQCLVDTSVYGVDENFQAPVGLPVFGTCKNNCRGGKLLTLRYMGYFGIESAPPPCNVGLIHNT